MINDLLEKYKIKAKSINIKSDLRMIETDNEKYIIKESKVKDLYRVYNYLESRNFSYYVKPINNIEEDNYEIYPYIEENDIPDEQKAEDLITIASYLHSQTSYYKILDLDEVKEIYEKYIKQLDYLDHYYHDLQDVIETRVFMSPSEYSLIRNISQFYAAIYYSREYLERWYKIIKDKLKERNVQLHNNLDLSHYITGAGNRKILLSWNKANKGNPIYDLIIFYRNNYQKFDFLSLFRQYESKYPLLEEEKYLLYCILALPDKVVFDNTELSNCIKLSNYLLYMEKTSDFLLKQDPKPSEE